MGRRTKALAAILVVITLLGWLISWYVRETEWQMWECATMASAIATFQARHGGEAPETIDDIVSAGILVNSNGVYRVADLLCYPDIPAFGLMVNHIDSDDWSYERTTVGIPNVVYRGFLPRVTRKCKAVNSQLKEWSGDF